eukprot:141676-Heterocapsa_arctica.AAC.1
MAVRKSKVKLWAMKLRFGRLRPEGSWLRSRESISAAYIHCSKCYERVDHRDAATAAVKTGCNSTIVALYFDTYRTSRIIQ